MARANDNGQQQRYTAAQQRAEAAERAIDDLRYERTRAEAELREATRAAAAQVSEAQRAVASAERLRDETANELDKTKNEVEDLLANIFNKYG